MMRQSLVQRWIRERVRGMRHLSKLGFSVPLALAFVVALYGVWICCIEQPLDALQEGYRRHAHEDVRQREAEDATRKAESLRLEIERICKMPGFPEGKATELSPANSSFITVQGIANASGAHIAVLTREASANLHPNDGGIVTIKLHGTFQSITTLLEGLRDAGEELAIGEWSIASEDGSLDQLAFALRLVGSPATLSGESLERYCR